MVVNVFMNPCIIKADDDQLQLETKLVTLYSCKQEHLKKESRSKILEMTLPDKGSCS